MTVIAAQALITGNKDLRAMTEGLGPVAIVWGAIAIASIMTVLLKNRLRPLWRTYQFHWRQVMPVWWSIFWRAAVYGIIGGHFIGDAARIVAIATGHAEGASTSGSIANWLAAFVLSIVAVKEALQLHVGRLSGAVTASSLGRES